MKHFMMHAFAVLLLCNYNSELNSSGYGPGRGQVAHMSYTPSTGWNPYPAGRPAAPLPLSERNEGQYSVGPTNQRTFYANGGRRYTGGEDLYLIELVTSGCNWDEISVLMDRSPGACKARFDKLRPDQAYVPGN
ncbi:MAG: hypothetical protein LBR89_02425 [Holosporales bacterium]|jgi:hypothetical protein|nr:hypothetical protein [Holosporales bacterium]